MAKYIFFHAAILISIIISSAFDLSVTQNAPGAIFISSAASEDNEQVERGSIEGTQEHDSLSAEDEIIPVLDPDAAAGLGMRFCSGCEEECHEEYTKKPRGAQNSTATNSGAGEEKSDLDRCSLCGGLIRSYEGREFMCKHRFHKQCIRSWVDSKGTFCPVCHSDLKLMNGGSYTKVIAQQIEKYYSTPLKHWGLQSTRKVQ